MKFRKLVKHNNWEYITYRYKLNDEDFIKFNETDLYDVKLPDGTEISTKLKPLKYSQDYNDMGNTHTAYGTLWGFEININEIPIWIDLDKVKIKI